MAKKSHRKLHAGKGLVYSNTKSFNRSKGMPLARLSTSMELEQSMETYILSQGLQNYPPSNLIV